MRWPGKVPANRNSDAIFASIDFLPTFAGLCGFETPDDRRIDGIDQTELLLGKTEKGRDYFYFNRAGVRKGKWKYLRPNAHFHGYAVEDGRNNIVELYDLEEDLGERNNLADKHPDLVLELKELTNQLESKRVTVDEPTQFQIRLKDRGPQEESASIKVNAGQEAVMFEVSDQSGIGSG